MLLEGYINVKKQGDRTFHITCIGQQSADTNPSQNLDPESVSLSTYMFQTKQPQVNNCDVSFSCGTPLLDVWHSFLISFYSFKYMNLIFCNIDSFCVSGGGQTV